MKENKIKLMGVVHLPTEIPYVIQKLERMQPALDPARGIGLEANTNVLNAFEQIYKNQQQKMELLDQVTAQGIERMKQVRKSGVSAVERIQDQVMRDNRLSLEFFYEIFAFAKKHGIAVKPMVTAAPGVRAFLAQAEGIRAERWGDHRTADEALREYILFSTPIRERGLLEEIVKERPAVVIMGDAHVKEMRMRLQKRKVKARIVFRTNFERHPDLIPSIIGMRPIVRQVRQEYVRRKKESRARRIRMGIARVKPK